MYKIIGADQREYGPGSADQIRQGLAEGRANGRTLLQGEGRTDWAPLSSYVEFGDALASQVPPLTEAAPPPRPSDPSELAAYIRAHDYDIDIGDCLSRSWALV